MLLQTGRHEKQLQYAFDGEVAVKGLFWNVRRHPDSDAVLAELAVEHSLDIIIVAEYEGDAANIAKSVTTRTGEEFGADKIANKRVKIVHSIDRLGVVYDDERMSIRWSGDPAFPFRAETELCTMPSGF